jgi:branched-chain amino acid transport system substrate-binding protein
VLHNPAVPNEFLDILSLAGIIIFSITSLSAILSSIFVKKDNLLYLGTQLVLLSICLLLSTHWSYPLWFSAIFSSAEFQVRFVETLFLLSIAFTIDVALKVVVWDRALRHHGGQSVPPLLIGAMRTLVYLFALLTILQFVFDKSITALAALSGAFALIIGLSAQTTLGEMFAGIAIALSRPLSIGDWVKIGNLDEGKVIDMTWRMVRIETKDRVVLNVPNRSVADQPVRNFSHPNRAVRISEAIYFPQSDDPALIQDLLTRAIAAAHGVLADPKPAALYRGAKDGVCEYTMRYYIDDYGLKDNVTERVWKNVVEQIARSKFKIAFPRRIVEIETGEIPALPHGAAIAKPER